MKYFAFFFSVDNYVGKCLSLIRLIGNPSSRSMPHITLRLFQNLDYRLENTRNMEITHLNIMKPGTFNIDIEKPPFVVYIRCESEELEYVEYKPDYPRSRLHITLYEGNDKEYATSLYSCLKEKDWHFRLPFDPPLKLIENEVGSKKNKRHMQSIDSLLTEILNENSDTFFKKSTINAYKLQLIKRILDRLYEHLETYEGGTIKVSSNYIDTIPDNALLKSGTYIDKYMASFDNSLDMAKTYVTPPEYAKDMALCAIEAFGSDSRKIDFGDPMVGTGSLFIALKNTVEEINKATGKKYVINSAIGIDINREMAKDAYCRYFKRGLKVIYGDALDPDIPLADLRNLMLVNPPYIRYHNIPTDYRLQIQALAEEQTSIKIRGDAGLYVYHLLIMDKWLREDGIAVWLLPSIFLQTRYGEAIRQYLLNNVQLVRLHLYDYYKQQFENALTSTAVVVFKKCAPTEFAKVVFSEGDSISNPTSNNVISRKRLVESLYNWKNAFNEGYCEQKLTASSTNEIVFGDLFDIKRGIATGANSFFVLERSRAREYGIPEFAVKPLLPKAVTLKSRTIDANGDGYPDIEKQLVLIDCELDEETIKMQYPLFHEYLQGAKKKEPGGKAIVERTLVRARHPWYKQERREPCPFLLTYMGRGKKNSASSPLYFVFNKSNAVALNTYLFLYPRGWLLEVLNKNNTLYGIVFRALEASADRIISHQTRIYSGGLKKLEPGELKKLPVGDLPNEIIEAYDKNNKLVE